MRIYLYIATIILFAVSSIQAERSLPASPSVSSYRPEGELRIWTFVMRDSVIGQLQSRVIGTDEEDGQDIVNLSEILALDYTKLGSELTMRITGEVRVSENGAFVGNDLEFIVNGQTEKLKLRRDDELLKGYSTRGGERQNQEKELREGLFAADNNFIDQFEMFFAMHDLNVGDTIRDSLFVPQNMSVVPIEAVIREFTYKTFYNRVGDSVFIIDLLAPQQMELLFTTSKHLAKVINEQQQMKVYLDAVTVEPVAPKRPAFSFSNFVSLLPNYALYFIIGLLAALFFVGNGYRWGSSWLGLVIGGFIFLPVAFIQLPLQESMFIHLYLPKLQSGGSPYFWGLLTVLPAAILQEGLKFIALFVPAQNKLLQGKRLIAFGAMLGAGLGIIESCFLDSLGGQGSLASWSLLERVFMMVFHTTSGALIGWSVSLNLKTAVKAFVGATIVHLLLRYLPLFVQQAKATPQLMHLMLAIIVLIFLSVTLLVMKKNREA